MEQLKRLEKDHEISQDEHKHWSDEVQKLTDQYIKRSTSCWPTRKRTSCRSDVECACVESPCSRTRSRPRRRRMSPSSWTATAAGRRSRGMPRASGHRRGAEAVRRTVEACARERHPLADPVRLLVRELAPAGRRGQRADGPAAPLPASSELAELCRNGVRLRVIGDRAGCRRDIRDADRGGRGGQPRQRARRP